MKACISPIHRASEFNLVAVSPTQQMYCICHYVDTSSKINAELIQGCLPSFITNDEVFLQLHQLLATIILGLNVHVSTITRSNGGNFTTTSTVDVHQFKYIIYIQICLQISIWIFVTFGWKHSTLLLQWIINGWYTWSFSITSGLFITTHTPWTGDPWNKQFTIHLFS